MGNMTEPAHNHTGSGGTTSTSFLRKLKADEPNNEAWEHFNSLCITLVKSMCYDLPLSDRDDIAQQVSINVYKKIGDFQRQRKGSFRKWLRQITANARNSHFRNQEPAKATEDEVLNRIVSPTEEEQKEEERTILEYGLQLVERDFCPEWVRAFKGMVFERTTAAELAKELGISQESVRQAKFKVLKRLKEELEGLLD